MSCTISLSFSIDVGHPPPSTEFQHDEKSDSYQHDIARKVVRKRLDDHVQELDASQPAIADMGNLQFYTRRYTPHLGDSERVYPLLFHC